MNNGKNGYTGVLQLHNRTGPPSLLIRNQHGFPLSFRLFFLICTAVEYDVDQDVNYQPPPAILTWKRRKEKCISKIHEILVSFGFEAVRATPPARSALLVSVGQHAGRPVYNS